MKKEFVGEQLKAARQYRGLTVEQLADQINVKKQSVSLYENNKMTPEFDKVLLMSNALNFPFDYFMQKPKVNIQSKSTYFRALLTTSKKYRVEQIRKMEVLSSIYKVLSDYIDFPQVDLPDLSNGNYSPSEAASLLREHWKLGNAPIKDIISILEDKGIIVTTFATSTDQIDAFSHLIDVDGNEIYLIALSSNKKSAVRKHFDVAHELGHIVMHEWSEDIESLSREEFRTREKEANEFAASFLLPSEEFLADVSAYPSKIEYYIQLKKKWKISISAMIMRAYSLGAISFHQYQYMWKVYNAKGYRTNEPLDDKIVTAPPTILKNAVKLLMEENVFTANEFMEELRIYGIPMNPNEVENLLGLKCGTLSPKIEKKTTVLKLKVKDSGEEENNG